MEEGKKNMYPVFIEYIRFNYLDSQYLTIFFTYKDDNFIQIKLIYSTGLTYVKKTYQIWRDQYLDTRDPGLDGARQKLNLFGWPLIC